MLSQKQKSQRIGGLTATDMVALAGLSPTKKPVDVYLEKVGVQVPVSNSHRGALSPAAIGHLLEPFVAKLFQAASGERVVRNPYTTTQAADCAWALATVDGWVVPSGLSDVPTIKLRDALLGSCADGVAVPGAALFEAKVVGPRMMPHWAEDKPPVYVQVQVQWQMRVTGYRKATVAALLGTEFRMFDIERDDATVRALNNLADAFWTHHVAKCCPPPPDGSDNYQAMVRRQLKIDGPAAVATSEIEDLHAEHQRIRQDVAAHERRLKEIEQTVGLLLGDCSVCKTSVGKIQVCQRRGAIDWKAALAELCPTADADLERFRRPTTTFLRLF